MFTTKRIKIYPNKPFINKSYIYLIHHFKLCDKNSIKLLNKFDVKACGIGDLNYNENYIDNNYFFILMNVNANFKRYINEVRDLSFYIDDYIYPDKKFNLQMIVLELPKPETKVKFLEGRYSDLLEPYELDIVYNKIINIKGVEYYNKAYDVIIKNERARLRFQKNLKDDFETTINISDDRELDYPPLEINEVFNY